MAMWKLPGDCFLAVTFVIMIYYYFRALCFDEAGMLRLS